MSFAIEHPPLSAGWQIKLERAREHLNGIRSELRWYDHGQPYHVAPDLDPVKSEYVVRFLSADAIPMRVAALVGDCLQNFRSALNQVTCALVASNGGTITNRTEFPIFTDKALYRKDVKSKIDGLSPVVEAVVKGLQPFNQPTHPLWHLQELARIDRHRQVRVFSSIAVGSALLFRGRAIPLPVSSRPFQPQAEIVRFKFADLGDLTGVNPEVDMYLRLAISIAFDEAGIAAGLNILTVLGDIERETTGVLTKLGETQRPW